MFRSIDKQIDMSAELRRRFQCKELTLNNSVTPNRWERGTALPQFDTVMRIADILQVSLDELAGRSAVITEPKIHNTELLNLYQQVDSLPDASQQALVLVRRIAQ